tara:strand:- start:16520 stop:17785 length:1266 start_codon:yes stop_codon:yes gene_type:complete
MLSHKKIINRFNQLEKKYYNDKSFEISKNHLHALIWNKNFVFPKFTLLRFITNSILFILSKISIYLCKIKKISVANYFIVHKNKKGLYDFRSDYVLKEYDFRKSLNIIRCPSFIDSIKSYIIYPNAVFFLSFDYFNSPFFYRKKNLKNNYKILHEKEKKNFNQIKKIFHFLQIKRFISIDDQRIIQVFLKVCDELNIKSFGYMHYKFSKFIVGIRYLCFDNFLVWSDYFKKKLIEVNKNYRYKKILISGFRDKNINKKIHGTEVNILYLIDLDLKFKFTSDLLKKLNQIKKINLYVKLRPQVNETIWEKFCIKENIRYFKFENLDKVNQLIRMDYFIGNISTAILEAPLYRAMPLKIISNNDFADDLIKDKVVKKVRNFNDIVKIIRNRPHKKQVEDLLNKIWGKKRYKSYAIKNFLNKYA